MNKVKTTRQYVITVDVPLEAGIDHSTDDLKQKLICAFESFANLEHLIDSMNVKIVKPDLFDSLEAELRFYFPTIVIDANKEEDTLNVLDEDDKELSMWLERKHPSLNVKAFWEEGQRWLEISRVTDFF